MRLKIFLMFITLFITVMNIIVIFLFHAGNIESELMYDLSLAIIGSAVLGFLYSLVEYYDSKRLILEKIDNLSWKIKTKIELIRPFTPFEPIDLLIKCFNEESNNEFKRKVEIDCDDNAKQAFISHLVQNGHITAEIVSEYEEKCEDFYDFKMKKYKCEIEKIMRSYIELSKLRVDELTEAFKSLNYVFGFQKYNYIENEIIQPILSIMDSIRASTFHFEEYFSSKDKSVAPCLLKLNELQVALFESTKTYENHIITTTIKPMFTSKLEASINHLKVFTVFSKTPKYENRVVAVFQERSEDPEQL